MQSITFKLPLILGLSAGLAASAIAQNPDTSNSVTGAPNANAAAANAAAATNPAPVENLAAVVPNANASSVNPAAATNPAPADIPATSSGSSSSPKGPGRGGAKIGGRGGKGHLGHKSIGKARGVKVRSGNHVRGIKTADQKSR
jgi:hypothetical protein